MILNVIALVELTSSTALHCVLVSLPTVHGQLTFTVTEGDTVVEQMTTACLHIENQGSLAAFLNFRALSSN